MHTRIKAYAHQWIEPSLVYLAHGRSLILNHNQNQCLFALNETTQNIPYDNTTNVHFPENAFAMTSAN